MRTTRLSAAVLLFLAILAGCGGDEGSPSTTSTAEAPITTAGADTTAAVATTAGVATTTAAPAATDALKAALLVPADVPGSTPSPRSPEDIDYSGCFSGNPFGAKTDPNQVMGPSVQLTEGGAQRQFGSRARQGTPEQAKAFVATAASPAGSACMLTALRVTLSSDPNPPRIDASGLAGTGRTAAVADGGAVLAFAGTLTRGDDMVQVGVDTVVFSKGPVVVYLSATTLEGPGVSAQALELARKIAARLP